MITNKILNIFTENIYPDWEIDELECIKNTRKIVDFYLQELTQVSCLDGFDFDTLTFDILFCDSVKTHQINREYRDKDYPADIITFAIFADDESKFILDGDINLGEIIIALDKVKEEALKAGVSDRYELYFLIAHGILHLLGFDHQTEEDYNFVVGVQKKALRYAQIGEKDV
ncbi:MAG: rRNA maturation RNase YbeY [Candidatus Gastranaerophilales bacterium]|nr:rRNA maturation RNase YbeY [Candidatus Gastranaerophilales bacterium]